MMSRHLGSLGSSAVARCRKGFTITQMVMGVAIMGVMAVTVRGIYTQAREYAEYSALKRSVESVNRALDGIRSVGGLVGAGALHVDTTTVTSLLDALAAGVSVDGKRYSINNRDKMDARQFILRARGNPPVEYLALLRDKNAERQDPWYDASDWDTLARSNTLDGEAGYLADYFNAVRDSDAFTDEEKAQAEEALTELLANQERGTTGDRSIDASGITVADMLETDSMRDALVAAGYGIPAGTSVMEFAEQLGWVDDDSTFMDVVKKMGQQGVRGGISLDGIKVATLDGVRESMLDYQARQVFDYSGADFEDFDWAGISSLNNVRLDGARNIDVAEIVDANGYAYLSNVGSLASVDFSGLDGAQLSNLELYDADVSGSNLTAAQLAQTGSLWGISGLENLDFSGVSDYNWQWVGGVDLRETNIDAGALIESVATKGYGYIENAQFGDVDFSGVNLAGGYLDMYGVSFDSISGLSGKNFEGGAFYGWQWNEEQLGTEVNIDWADTDFTGMYISGPADFTGVDPAELLKASELYMVSFAGMDFSHVDPASLTDTRLRNVDFTGATGLTAEHVAAMQAWDSTTLATVEGFADMDFSGVDFSVQQFSGGYTYTPETGGVYTPLDLRTVQGIPAQVFADASRLERVLLPEGLDWGAITSLPRLSTGVRYWYGVNFGQPENFDARILFNGERINSYAWTGFDGVDFSGVTADTSKGLSSLRGFDWTGTTGMRGTEVVKYSTIDYMLGAGAVDWTGASFAGRNLKGVDWTGANITVSQLFGADYIGAGIYTGLDMSQGAYDKVNIHGVGYDPLSQYRNVYPADRRVPSLITDFSTAAVPPSGAQIMNSLRYWRRYPVLRGIDYVSLDGVDFSGVSLASKIMSNVDLTGARNLTAQQLATLRHDSWGYTTNITGMDGVVYDDGRPDGLDFAGVSLAHKKVVGWDFTGVHNLEAQAFANVQQLQRPKGLSEHDLDWASFDPSANQYGLAPYADLGLGNMGVTAEDVNAWETIGGLSVAGMELTGLNVRREQLAGSSVDFRMMEETWDDENSEWVQTTLYSPGLYSTDDTDAVIAKLQQAIDKGLIPPYGEWTWMGQVIPAHPDF